MFPQECELNSANDVDFVERSTVTTLTAAPFFS